MSDSPYRTPGAQSPNEPKAPTPRPKSIDDLGPNKWRNPLWLHWFDIALGGRATSAHATRQIVDYAEQIADEAWTRAANAGHPHALELLIH